MATVEKSVMDFLKSNTAEARLTTLLLSDLIHGNGKIVELYQAERSCQDPLFGSLLGMAMLKGGCDVESKEMHEIRKFIDKIK